MFNKILVVCIGNICRSPVGEALLQKALSNSHQVTSAGLAAMVDSPASEYSIEVLKNSGIDITHHRAQQLTPEMVKVNDLILVMEQFQLKEIEHAFPFARGKVFRIGHWRNLEIPDPYLQPKSAFEKMKNTLESCTQDWTQQLIGHRKPS